MTEVDKKRFYRKSLQLINKERDVDLNTITKDYCLNKFECGVYLSKLNTIISKYDEKVNTLIKSLIN
jgi:hypothetical protein